MAPNTKPHKPQVLTSCSPKPLDLPSKATSLRVVLRYCLYLDYGIAISRCPTLDRHLGLYVTLGYILRNPAYVSAAWYNWFYRTCIEKPSARLQIDDKAVAERISFFNGEEEDSTEGRGGRSTHREDSVLDILIENKAWGELARKMWWDRHVGIPLVAPKFDKFGEVNHVHDLLIQVWEARAKSLFVSFTSPVDFQLRSSVKKHRADSQRMGGGGEDFDLTATPSKGWFRSVVDFFCSWSGRRGGERATDEEKGPLLG